MGLDFEIAPTLQFKTLSLWERARVRAMIDPVTLTSILSQRERM
jgi:hypothetical protein